VDSAAAHLAPLLARLVDYERSRPSRREWDLSTVRRLLARPGLGPLPRPAVQVGGSKGKGTTCAFLEALVLAAGRRPGVYSSPHLVTLRERIRCGGRDIELEELESLLRTILDAAGPGRAPTFFEVMTVAAAEWFAGRQADLAIYEVGLGGRHDATTALPVDASVVTTIELEHTEVLGDTIAAIAGEKAHVVRPGGVGFTAAGGEALAVLRRHAQDCGAQLFALGEEIACEAPTFDAEGCSFRLRLPGGAAHAVRLTDAAEFEVPALALAAAVFAELLPDAPLVLDPAPRPLLPGRFEVLVEPDGEALVLDGAHTAESLAAVARELSRRWPDRRAMVLFAAAGGKRWRTGLSALLPRADSVVVTGLSGTSSEDPAVIAKWIASQGGRSETADDVDSGLAALRRRPGPRVVVGSFYLVGQVRALVANAPRQNTNR